MRSGARAVESRRVESALATQAWTLSQAAFDAGSLDWLGLEEARLRSDQAQLGALAAQMELAMAHEALALAMGE